MTKELFVCLWKTPAKWQLMSHADSMAHAQEIIQATDAEYGDIFLAISTDHISDISKHADHLFVTDKHDIVRRVATLKSEYYSNWLEFWESPESTASEMVHSCSGFPRKLMTTLACKLVRALPLDDKMKEVIELFEDHNYNQAVPLARMGRTHSSGFYCEHIADIIALIGDSEWYTIANRVAWFLSGAKARAYSVSKKNVADAGLAFIVRDVIPFYLILLNNTSQR